jgi:hypothetical protein
VLLVVRKRSRGDVFRVCGLMGHGGSS